VTADERRTKLPRTFDPEAEQEIDFSQYRRILAARWWLPAAAVVLGAIIGYTLSLGAGQVFKATATVYLGQPYTASGNVSLQGLQTNPSTVGTIAHSEAIDDNVAAHCNTRTSAFRNGVSTQAISGNLSKNGQNPLVAISVQAKSRRVAACAANGLARSVVADVSPYASVTIASFRQQISADRAAIAAINAGVSSAGVATADKLLLQVQLRAFQTDEATATQLLHQATEIEAPKIVTPAASIRVTALSRRNTVAIAAIIGLLLGVIAALAWDRVVPQREPPQ
jgi:capsular polysaccharide biosynthesis protein